MARGRMLNKTVCASVKFQTLPDDTCRLMATWIIAHLDKRGVFYGDPAMVRSSIFPRRSDVTTEDVARYLDAIERAGLMIRFDAKGDVWQWWPGFTDNQAGLRADRETTDYPQPPTDMPDACRNDAGMMPETSRNESGLNEMKGIERKGIERESSTEEPETSIWKIIQRDLAGQMTKATFDTQIRDAQLLSIDDPVRIGFHSQIAADWVGGRLNRVVCSTLRRHLKRDVQVQYEVMA